MFERWPEPQRRWFLLTFCAAAWTLFLNSFAHLGDDFAAGGVGPDATHAASIFGTLAVWTIVWSAFHLRLRHWAFAVVFGVAVSSAAVEFGLREHAAAAAWTLACDRGEGAACRELAEFYEAGESPVHGWLDAERLHHDACVSGVSTSCFQAPTLVAPKNDDARKLLDSGYPDLRLAACDVLQAECAKSATADCPVITLRCERARSPRAGTN